MNFSRFTIAAILMGAASVFALHAAVKDLPVKTVNGRLYHYTKFRPKRQYIRFAISSIYPRTR